jgi:N-acetyl-gamma-glutamyl-phosphate reductase
LKPKVFIDGGEGTTGLQLRDRLGGRDDIELLAIGEGLRKDAAERARLMGEADLVFLCLPDEAARESVSLIENDRTRVIDASTAHRTHPDWVYGLPELGHRHRNSIASARFVANPGCHATGFIASVYPLVAHRVIGHDCPLTCFSLTGYSGGGKAMIADYESLPSGKARAPGLYALNLRHKHLPEMLKVTGLTRAPVFCPIVGDFHSGMATSVALHNGQLRDNPAAEDIREFLAEHYAGQPFVTVAPALGDGTLYSDWGVGTNSLEITVSGNFDTTLITARFDNLGKGASGAAVQCMNLMLGMIEETGLRI